MLYFFVMIFIYNDQGCTVITLPNSCWWTFRWHTLHWLLLVKCMRQETCPGYCAAVPNLQGFQIHRHSQPTAVWSQSNRQSSSAPRSIHLPYSPSHRKPAGQALIQLRNDDWWASGRLWMTEWSMYLKWRVSVLWVDDVNPTGDLGDDWHKTVLDVAAVSSWSKQTCSS